MVTKNQTPFAETFVSHSKFTMLRCLTVMAHADGFIDLSEIAYIEHFIEKLPQLGEDQIATLRNDLKSPPPIEDLLREMNDPRYRGQLVYFARIMAYKDGTLHPDEEQLLNYIYKHVMDGVDKEKIRKDVEKYVLEAMDEHTKMIEAIRPDDGLFWAVDQALLQVGVDVMGD